MDPGPVSTVGVPLELADQGGQSPAYPSPMPVAVEAGRIGQVGHIDDALADVRDREIECAESGGGGIDKSVFAERGPKLEGPSSSSSESARNSAQTS